MPDDSLFNVYPMDYPDELEIDLDGMAQGGDAVGRWQGLVVFASGGLPGERVRIVLHERKTGYARGAVVEVLRASPDRAPPRLPAASHMPWQHIAYPAQVRLKQTILAEQLARLAGLNEPPIEPMIAAAHPWGYRNTASLHVEHGRIGYYAAGSHEVVDLAADPLLLPVLNTCLAGLRASYRAEHQELRTADSSPALEGVTLRASAAYGYAVAALHGSGDLSNLAARWRSQVPALAGVEVLPARAPRTPRRRESEPDGAEAMVSLHEELGGVVFELGIDSFFQVHTAQAEQLLATARDMLALRPGERLLDAYSGAGTFALPLARGLREVVAIEDHPRAVADGRRSAALNEIANVTFVSAAVERVLPGIEPPIDAALLDPPRRGCHPAALAALLRLAPARIVYISCHPGILARDLRPLLDGGYRLARVTPVDLFPQTPHIECVALLTHPAG